MSSGAGDFEFLEPGQLSDGELELTLARKVPADASNSIVPCYRFDMKVGMESAGGIRFRAGNNLDIERYAGNLGYNVNPEFRGRHFAERACRLLLPFAIAHGFRTLWITCDPENAASRRTCERLGAEFVDIVALPEDHEMHRDGERAKCRYRLEIP